MWLTQTRLQQQNTLQENRPSRTLLNLKCWLQQPCHFPANRRHLFTDSFQPVSRRQRKKFRRRRLTKSGSGVHTTGEVWSTGRPMEFTIVLDGARKTELSLEVRCFVDDDGLTQGSGMTCIMGQQFRQWLQHKITAGLALRIASMTTPLVVCFPAAQLCIVNSRLMVSGSAIQNCVQRLHVSTSSARANVNRQFSAQCEDIVSPNELPTFIEAIDTHTQSSTSSTGTNKAFLSNCLQKKQKETVLKS